MTTFPSDNRSSDYSVKFHEICGVKYGRKNKNGKNDICVTNLYVSDMTD